MNKEVKILTKTEQNELLAKYDSIQRKLYEVGDTPSILINKTLTEVEKSHFESFCKQNDINYDSTDSARTAITSYSNYLKKLDVVSLTLTYNPPVEHIESMKYSLANRLTKDTVIDYKVNDNIMGGLIIEYKGRYTDFSLRALVEKVFQNVI